LASSANYTQENRFITLTTPLGDDVLLLASFAGNEGISRMYSFNLELLSETKSIDFDKIVGQKVTISVLLTDGSTERYINGYVSRFAQTGADSSLTRYHMEVVPWLWFLTRDATCSVFQDLTIPEIIADVFDAAGFTEPHYRNSCTATYPSLTYCVQYRETCFNFVSRLMEHAGIYYYFEHTKDGHVLVMADSPSAHGNCPDQSTLRYSPNARGQIDDVVTTWTMEQEYRTGKISLEDYNFETPDANMLATDPTVVKVSSNSTWELYDYPGLYDKQSDGNAVAKVRMEAEEATHLIATGSSSCRTLTPGYNFDLEEFEPEEMNKSWMLLEVHHTASVAGTYDTGSGSTSSYANHFTCIDASTQYRPPRLTPKPTVQGPQTAVVVGPSGEELYVDKYGRVRVHFFWDRLGKPDESPDECSCWIRVSQPWAGEGWGAMFLPRVGQEVIVSFLEGDPDRPIITGRVYNADQTVPYALPANSTRSTIKTSSSKGGGTSQFNELRFEDKAGSEQLFMNAQKDMDVNVLNDLRECIAANRSLMVGGNQMESVGGNLSTNVSGNISEKAGSNLSIQVGQNLQEKSGMNYAHEAGMEIHLKAGMNVVIEAGLELTIKAGGNFVNIGPAGVAISGTLVLINSGGAAGSGSGSSPTSPVKPDKADDGTKGTKLS
jgi:type VI secretion system secreted protein VgrG